MVVADELDCVGVWLGVLSVEDVEELAAVSVAVEAELLVVAFFVVFRDVLATASVLALLVAVRAVV